MVEWGKKKTVDSRIWSKKQIAEGTRQVSNIGGGKRNSHADMLGNTSSLSNTTHHEGGLNGRK